MDVPPADALPAPRKGLATSSLILGLLGSLCLGPIAGIPAVILGHLALRRARRDPAAHGGKGVAIAGLTLGYVSFVVGLAMFAFLLTLAVPTFRRERAEAREATCVAQLQRLHLATQRYAAEHQGLYPTNFALLGPHLRRPADLACPADNQHLPLATTNWSDLRPLNISYLFLSPGARQETLAGQPVFRCPVHDKRILGDGSIAPQPRTQP